MMCIIFQDGDTPFGPDMIHSQFLNGYIVVRQEGEEQYKVVVTAKKEVANFGEKLPSDGIFNRGTKFRLTWGNYSKYQSSRRHDTREKLIQ